MRPETGSENVRNRFCDHMGQYGISSDRISFVATRINHLDQYNNIDISLDVFPHTGELQHAKVYGWGSSDYIGRGCIFLRD